MSQDKKTDNTTNVRIQGGVIDLLLRDVICLAKYAVEVGRLPADVHLSDIYRMWSHKIDKKQELEDIEIDRLEFYYRLLEEELSPITAVSLLATDSSEAKRTKDYSRTDAGRHARNMWFTAFATLAAIMLINVFQYTFEMFSGDWAVNYLDQFEILTVLYWISGSLVPFAYGAFGASVRLLRITEERLRNRTFDPRRITEHRNRFVLGTLSGGVMVMLYSSGGVGDVDVKLTEAALGFIAGYSIDLLFALIDRLVGALTPQGHDTQAQMQRKADMEQKRIESARQKKYAKLLATNAQGVEDIEQQEPSATPHLKPVVSGEEQKPEPKIS